MQEIVFDYHYEEEAERYAFFRIPKALYTEPIFKGVSDGAKILYGQLLDLMALSRKSGWIDEEGRVFVRCSIDKVKEIMIFMGVDMMISDLMRKTIIPLCIVGVLVAVFYPVCTENGKCDYFLLWILVGWPFDVGKMFLWMPKNLGLAGNMGVFALNIIIGGLIGGIIAAFKVVFSFVNLLLLSGKGILKLLLPIFKIGCF